MQGTICIEQHESIHKGVVWLGSPAALVTIALIATYCGASANMAIWTSGKHTAWSTHNVKHKTYPEGEKIHGPMFSSNIYLTT